MTSPLPPTQSGRRIHRELFLTIVRTAHSMGQLRFSRDMHLAWLAAFPGDLLVNLSYARLLLQEGHPGTCLAVLEPVCQADPEYLEAFTTRLQAENRLRSSQANTSKALPASGLGVERTRTVDTLSHIFALGGSAKSSSAMSKSGSSTAVEAVTGWSYHIRQARRALAHDNAPGQQQPVSIAEAEEVLNEAIGAGTDDPLVAITHLRLLDANQVPPQTILRLIEFYQQRWPDCLQFSLLMGNALMESGEPDRAVQLLHKVVTRDITGQVVKRLWGDYHPFLALWPDKLEVELDLAIPASVTAAMGWNQLSDHNPILGMPPGPAYAPGQRSPSMAGVAFAHSAANAPYYCHAVPESLKSVTTELERVAEHLNRPGLAGVDGRFPVYVVLTAQRGLLAQYGPQAAAEIERGMKRLVAAVKARRGWHALLFYADQDSFPGVPPARHKDPWSIKLALADLDNALGRKGEMIGAVLIVGGPEVVPFHNLPNPVDDSDDDIPSDNPYGTRDENYFIPEWPVGRLPGGCSPDAGMLLHSLSAMADQYAARSHKLKPFHTLRERLRSWLRRLRLVPGGKRSSFGYSAAIWRKSSSVVYQPIGEPRNLKISPPLAVKGEQAAPLPAARLGYFNLHGVPDAVEWFGQSDPFEKAGNGGSGDNNGSPEAGYVPDYPVAIRPQDIQNGGRAPEVVFTEACYGGHIRGKEVEEALALKFLQAGSQAVVGSTCTSYGSVTSPLIAADFLGHAFWSNIRQGFPAGESLRRAKISLAREMHQRQGYLDGEDQKTLISFVLYGDPLALPAGIENGTKSVLRSLKPPTRVKIVCDRQQEEEAAQAVPAEVIAYAKQVVRQYLPGMEEARISICQEHSECHAGSHHCPTAQLGAQSKTGSPGKINPKRRVLVLSKQVANHRHYARITLDEQNRMVKLVVSR